MAAPTVFTIPAHVAFVDALAAGLLARSGGDPLALARTTVLLPNRRAVRALTDAFVRASGPGLLLPRMTPVGDVDAIDVGLGDLGATAPAIDPTKRRLLLAQLIRRWRDLSAIEALRLADQLAAALDALAFEEADPAALTAFDPGELAHHWEKTLDFMRIIVDLWPPVLAAHGEVDPATDARARLDGLDARWRATPPPGPVVAAGFAAAAPPVARLLRTVARLSHGLVVLPGLDTAMGEGAWDAVRCRATEPDLTGPESEEHPQFTLKCLLDALGVARGEVAEWPFTGAGRRAARARRSGGRGDGPGGVHRRLARGSARPGPVRTRPHRRRRQPGGGGAGYRPRPAPRARHGRARRRRWSPPTAASPAGSRRTAAAGASTSTIRRAPRSS